MGAQIFTKIDREHDLRRWYAITWGPTLFEAWAVVCTWGRIGTDWSQCQVREFDTEEEAVAEAEAQIQQRRKRGYTLRQ